MQLRNEFFEKNQIYQNFFLNIKKIIVDFNKNYDLFFILFKKSQS